MGWKSSLWLKGHKGGDVKLINQGWGLGVAGREGSGRVEGSKGLGCRVSTCWRREAAKRLRSLRALRS